MDGFMTDVFDFRYLPDASGSAEGRIKDGQTMDGQARQADLRPERAQVPKYRLFRPDNPGLALGLAVNHLMAKPAFDQLQFGGWSRILVGQINRGHYRFVVDSQGRVVGFLGWALVSEAAAEAWLRGVGGFQGADCRSGDCIVFNAWSSDTSEVNPFVLEAAREAMLGCRLGFFKRYYKDGRIRPMRMNVNDFVHNHLSREV
jgi:hemolysin-activating ACP:hemolysin acyltransferase